MKKVLLGVLTAATVLTLGACGSKSETTKEVSTNKDSSEVAVESNTDSKNNTVSKQGVNPENFSISLDDAIARYKKEIPNTDITSIKIDSSFKKYYYEFEGMDDNKEYELKMDVESGEISEKRDENLDKDEQNGVKRSEEKLDLNGLKPIAEITKVALDQVGAGQATDWSLEKELSTTYWEVKIENGKQDHDIKIDAKTGDVLETELDD